MIPEMTFSLTGLFSASILLLSGAVGVSVGGYVAFLVVKKAMDWLFIAVHGDEPVNTVDNPFFNSFDFSMLPEDESKRRISVLEELEDMNFRSCALGETLTPDEKTRYGEIDSEVKTW